MRIHGPNRLNISMHCSYILLKKIGQHPHCRPDEAYLATINWGNWHKNAIHTLQAIRWHWSTRNCSISFRWSFWALFWSNADYCLALNFNLHEVKFSHFGIFIYSIHALINHFGPSRAHYGTLHVSIIHASYLAHLRPFWRNFMYINKPFWPINSPLWHTSCLYIMWCTTSN